MGELGKYWFHSPCVVGHWELLGVVTPETRVGPTHAQAKPRWVQFIGLGHALHALLECVSVIGRGVVRCAWVDFPWEKGSFRVEWLHLPLVCVRSFVCRQPKNFKGSCTKKGSFGMAGTTIAPIPEYAPCEGCTHPFLWPCSDPLVCQF
jgi:hypothetical protein